MNKAKEKTVNALRLSSEIRSIASPIERGARLMQMTKVGSKVVSRLLGIQQSQRVQKGFRAIKEGRPIGKKGRPSRLGPELERKLLDWVLANRNTSKITTMALRLKAIDLINEMTDSSGKSRETALTKSWPFYFLKKHKDILKVSKPRTIEKDLKIDTKELDSWFKKYKEAINYGKVNMTCPELIINLDEKPVKLG
eukprot:TRINITY_DN2790_c1_g2_i1.p2 TRINITY_DN2790_c1_g2~~TRINITY_DN2790_c1_g2_i1.p2  ORF type:complete len:196 (-),score=57.90 TRINITY_DN2790_c1_g2_i1:1451-2038(-)